MVKQVDFEAELEIEPEKLRDFVQKLFEGAGTQAPQAALVAELLVSNDLRQTSSCGTQLLITAPGVATRTQLNQLGQTLALQGTPLAGWVFLDPALSV